MANTLRLNSIPTSVFKVNAASCDGSIARADLLSMGRALMHDSLGHGMVAVATADGKPSSVSFNAKLPGDVYNRTNEVFSKNRLMYAANRFRAMMGMNEISDYDEFVKDSSVYYGNALFYQALAAIDREVVAPILPITYTEAVETIAQFHECEVGGAVEIDVGSNFIPLFQDSSWGAAQSAPQETFYNKPITLRPQPKTAWITMKWTQLIGNRIDFGRFYNNLAAGMYSKTMTELVSAFVTASQNTALVPSNMQTTFSDANFALLANLVAAQNGVPIGGVTAFGGYVPMSKVLPSSSIATMDAALAMLLGVDYANTGYLQKFKGVNVFALQDAIVPGTQNTAPATVLPTNRGWMFASNGYKPMAVAMNSGTPINLEYTPDKTADLTIKANVTMTLATSAIFGSKIGTFTI